METTTRTWTLSEATGRELREAAAGTGTLAECARRELARRAEAEASLRRTLGWSS